MIFFNYSYTIPLIYKLSTTYLLSIRYNHSYIILHHDQNKKLKSGCVSNNFSKQHIPYSLSTSKNTRYLICIKCTKFFDKRYEQFRLYLLRPNIQVHNLILYLLDYIQLNPAV